jgi:hypothetical protein
MAKYEYNGDSELVFPTLGITVNKGDVFEAPEGLVVDGVVSSSGKATKISAPVVVADEETPTTEDVK